MLKLKSLQEMPLTADLAPMGKYHVNLNTRLDAEGFGFVLREGETVEPVDGREVRRVCAIGGNAEVYCVDKETIALIRAARGEEVGEPEEEAVDDDADDEDVDEVSDEELMELPNTKEALLELAAQVGCEVDKRWGVGRLQDALAEHLEADDEEN